MTHPAIRSTTCHVPAGDGTGQSLWRTDLAGRYDEGNAGIQSGPAAIIMITAFISHSTQDRTFVEQELIPHLECLGIIPWYAQDDIKISAVWERSIREALIRADWVVVVLSPNAAKSEWVRSEVHWALENKPDKVIPVRLSPCDPAEVHIKLAGIQYADYATDQAMARQRMAALLGSDTPTHSQTAPHHPETAGGSGFPPMLHYAIGELTSTGRYEVVKVLERTGSGVSLLARGKPLGNLVFLKTYSVESGSTEHVQRLVAEIHTRSRLRHPILVTPLDVFSTKRTLFVVTEYLDGVENIRERLRKNLSGRERERLGIRGELLSPDAACQLLRAGFKTA